MRSLIVLAAVIAACGAGDAAGPPDHGSGGTDGIISGGTGAGNVINGSIVCTSPYSTVPVGACDLLQQSCPAGQTCRPVEGSGGLVTGCVDATGVRTKGEPCPSDDECGAKLFCIAGKCTPVCCVDSDEPCNGGTCEIHVSFEGGADATVCSYAETCVLLTANACPAGFDCHAGVTKMGLASCVPPSGAMVPELGSCTFLDDCASMAHCFGGDGLCHGYCHLTGGGSQGPGLGGCPAGAECLAQYAGQMIDFGVPDVGLCFPPAPDAGAGDAGEQDAGISDAGTD